MSKKPIFIAEIKTKSPFGFESKYSKETLTNKALEYGSWISVHTSPLYGGSFDDIYFLRKETKKPILAKGMHCHNDDIQKAIDLGADYVLVVDRFFYPWSADKVLFEITNPQMLLDIFERWRLLEENKIKFVFNGRNLNNGLPKKYIGDYHKYREKCGWLCGASLIKKPEDVNVYYPDSDAFIVGEHLVEFCKEYKK